MDEGRAAFRTNYQTSQKRWVTIAPGICQASKARRVVASDCLYFFKVLQTYRRFDLILDFHGAAFLNSKIGAISKKR